MFLNKYRDYIVGVAFLVLSIVLIVMAQALPASAVMEIGPDFMPTVIGVIMLVLSVVLLVMAFANRKTVQGEEVKDDAEYKRVLLSLLLSLAYVFLLQPVGFILSTLVYLFFQMMVLAPDEKRTKKEAIRCAIIVVIFTFVVFFLFRYGFKIILPRGIFSIEL